MKKHSSSSPVRAKKHLGQHFLTDVNIAAAIAEAVLPDAPVLLEIGPGTGFLTTHLLKLRHERFLLSEIDQESIDYLKKKFPADAFELLPVDFLTLELDKIAPSLTIAGNFPYYISTQIVFKIFASYRQVAQMVGMFQKEVAQRIAAQPNSKNYGILSVFIQAFYDAEYLFTVPAHVFDPPPSVDSGVVRLRRNQRMDLPVDLAQFMRVVKTAFGQRRKTLRNALRSHYVLPEVLLTDPVLDLRAENLSVEDFILLTQKLANVV